MLSQLDHTVAELLREAGIEAVHLSQQSALLRRMNLVVSHRDGAAVFYSLVSPQVAELLAVARRILTEVLTTHVELLDDLRSSARPAGG